MKIQTFLRPSQSEIQKKIAEANKKAKKSVPHQKFGGLISPMPSSYYKTL